MNFTFLQEISKELFFKKYALNNEESVEKVVKKVCKTISSKEKKSQYWEEEFYNQIISGKLIPGGRILANAKQDSKVKNYSNCFVIDIEDDLSKIYDSIKESALISKQGGGIGINFSKIRPQNDDLSVGGIASGPLSFMRVFDQSAKVIMTGGFRRSAFISILNIDHPDIEKFITCKKGDTNNSLTQMNISVGITNDFIHAVKKDLDWDLKFNNKVYKTIKAKYLFNLLCKNAFEHNEPGLLYLDVVNKYNNMHYAETINTTNPCGEVTLEKYGSCNLSSINLLQFVKNPFEKNSYFDFNSLKKTIKVGVRFLDNVIDLTQMPLNKINNKIREFRRCGLGITGLGNTFTMMKMKYGDEKSKKLTEQIAKTIRDTSYETSIELAKERGIPKGIKNNIKELCESNFIKKLPENLQKNIRKYGLRNIALNTIAPTGTTSITLGQNCSSGIEPVFALEYNRNIRQDDDTFNQEKVYDYSWLKFLEKNPDKEKPDYFVTTLEIDPYDAIDIQSIFQKYIDNSISKTLNLPIKFTLDEYKKLLLYTYEKELKGFTTFNPSGSMKGILEYSSSRIVPKRPKILNANVYKVTVKGEKWIVLIGLYQDKPYEVFAGKVELIDLPSKIKQVNIIKDSKRKYQIELDGEIIVSDINKAFNNENHEAITRLISTSLRHNVPLHFIIEQINKSKGTLADYEKCIARALKVYIKEGTISTEKCPECDQDLIFAEGCVKCLACSWSRCG